jgi:hypothetical protein
LKKQRIFDEKCKKEIYYAVNRIQETERIWSSCNFPCLSKCRLVDEDGWGAFHTWKTMKRAKLISPPVRKSQEEDDAEPRKLRIGRERESEAQPRPLRRLLALLFSLLDRREGDALTNESWSWKCAAAKREDKLSRSARCSRREILVFVHRQRSMLSSVNYN